MEKKTFELEIKELTEEGKFSGYLSTFGNVDAGGDLVDPGSFKKTLRDNKSFGFIWSHDSTFHGIIGSFTGREDTKGLFTEGGFFLELENGLQAYKTAKLLQSKGVKLGLSMGYRAIKYAYEVIDGITIRRLKEVKLREGSITLWPMNDETNLMVKEERGEEDFEEKPYPNEHACRLADPGQFVRIRPGEDREHNGKKYRVLYGFTADGKSREQAYRYSKTTWSADEARAHCKSHKGSFEAATGKELTFVCKSCGETQALTFTEPADATQPKAEPPETEPSELHSTLLKIADELKK